MAIDLIMFDFREPEENFFKKYYNECFNIKFVKESLTQEFLDTLPNEYLNNVTAISVFIHSKLNKNILERFKNLRLISTRSTGTNHIDLDYCQKRRIAVVNVSNYGAQAVAQYTFGLIIALVRKIINANSYFKKSNCADESFIGRNLEALTLGVIGTGAIGGSVCQIAQNFNMKILGYDIYPKNELTVKYGVEYVSMDELFAKSDIISINAPYTNENRNMIGANEFKKMEKKPYIINTSRGELINIADLKYALVSGQIAGLALDVLSCEALSFKKSSNRHDNCLTSDECKDELKIVEELREMENVIITPHIAYETQEAVDYILQLTMNNITDFYKGRHNGRVV